MKEECRIKYSKKARIHKTNPELGGIIRRPSNKIRLQHEVLNQYTNTTYL